MSHTNIDVPQCGVPAFRFHYYVHTAFWRWIAVFAVAATACLLNGYSALAGPHASDDSENTPHATEIEINVLANDSVDLHRQIDTTSVEITAHPTDGTAVVNATGTVTYTPNVGFDAVDFFEYTFKDDLGNVSNSGLVGVGVDSAMPPNAANDVDYGPYLQPLTVDVASNDTPIDAPLNMETVQVVTPPMVGATIVNSDGTITYTPDQFFSGLVSFTYTIKDELGSKSNEATVDLLVESTPPQLLDDSATTIAGVPVSVNVLINDVANGEPIDPASVQIISPPTNGTAIENQDGSIEYTPNEGFFGPDELSYTAKDAKNDEAQTPAMLSITVTNDIPDITLTETRIDGNLWKFSGTVNDDQPVAGRTVDFSGYFEAQVTVAADGTFELMKTLPYDTQAYLTAAYVDVCNADNDVVVWVDNTYPPGGAP